MPLNFHRVYSVIWTAAVICLACCAPTSKEEENIYEAFFTSFFGNQCDIMRYVALPPEYQTKDAPNYNLKEPLEACNITGDEPAAPICKEIFSVIYNLSTCRPDIEAIKKTLQEYVKPIYIPVQTVNVCEVFSNQSVFIPRENFAFRLVDRVTCRLICEKDVVEKACSFLLWGYQAQTILNGAITYFKTSSGSENGKAAEGKLAENKSFEKVGGSSPLEVPAQQDKTDSIDVSAHDVPTKDEQNHENPRPVDPRPSELSLDEVQNPTAKPKLDVSKFKNMESSLKATIPEVQNPTAKPKLDMSKVKNMESSMKATIPEVQNLPTGQKENAPEGKSGHTKSSTKTSILAKKTESNGKESLNTGIVPGKSATVPSGNSSGSIGNNSSGASVHTDKSETNILGHITTKGEHQKSSAKVKTPRDHSTGASSTKLGGPSNAGHQEGGKKDKTPSVASDVSPGENNADIHLPEEKYSADSAGRNQEDISNNLVDDGVKNNGDNVKDEIQAGDSSPPNSKSISQIGVPAEDAVSKSLHPGKDTADENEITLPAGVQPEAVLQEEMTNDEDSLPPSDGDDSADGRFYGGSSNSDPDYDDDGQDDKIDNSLGQSEDVSVGSEAQAPELQVNPAAVERTKNIVPVGFPQQGDKNFFFYFITIIVFAIGGYVLFHNKQKIFALIIEGRHERRRRNGASYRKLDAK